MPGPIRSPKLTGSYQAKKRSGGSRPIADMGNVWQPDAMIAAIMLLASAPASGCDLADMSGARAVHDALGRRAVKIMGAAATTGPKADALLNDLVDQSANFDLIIGDVGSPGTGVAGARSFAKAIKADEYLFLGWDYMDLPADPCGKQSITVDFISSRDKRISRIEFSFQQARLTAAKGWQHSFEAV